VIHGGPRFAKLILVEGSRPVAIRTIRFDLPEGGTTEARQNVLGLMGREANRFLLSAATGSVRGFVLTGDFHGERGLAKAVAEATRLTSLDRDWTDALQVEDPEQRDLLRMYGVAAFGLAATGFGVDPIGMDFRQAEFRYVKRFDAVKKTAAASLVLLCAFCAMFILHFGGEAASLKDKVVTVETEQVESFRRAFPNAGRIQDRTYIVDTAKSEFDRFVRKYGLGKTEASLPGSALAFYRQLASAMARMQSDLVKQQREFRLDLTRLEIKMESDRFVIRGNISERWVADRLAEELQQFKNIQFDQQPSTDYVKDNLQMTMNGKMVGRSE